MRVRIVTPEGVENRRMAGLAQLPTEVVCLNGLFDASVSEVSLQAVAEQQIWNDLKLLVRDWTALTKAEKATVRYLVTGFAQADALSDWKNSHELQPASAIMNRCFERYVRVNPCLNGQRRMFDKEQSFPSDHWVSLYMGHYMVWWHDCTLKIEVAAVPTAAQLAAA